MSWNSFSVSIATLGALTIGLITAETTLPFSSKPSILLQVSAGALPVADLESVLVAAEANAAQAREAAAKLDVQVKALKGLHASAQQQLQALDQRIRSKQAGEWASTTPLAAP